MELARKFRFCFSSSITTYVLNMNMNLNMNLSLNLNLNLNFCIILEGSSFPVYISGLTANNGYLEWQIPMDIDAGYYSIRFVCLLFVCLFII